MDIFNENTINDLLILSEHGENSGNNASAEPTIKRKLITAKVLIDRWENITTDILIHTSKVDDLFKELLSSNYCLDKVDLLSKGIWGANVYAVNEIPEDKCLILSLDKDGNLTGDVPSRAVASFTI